MHSVLCGQIAHAHVHQHVGVLHRTGHEVKDGFIPAHKVFQVRLLCHATNANGRFFANQQLSNAVAHPVERDVIVFLDQFIHKGFGQRPGAGNKVQQVAVVRVVLCLGPFEDGLKAGGGFDGGHGCIKFGLCYVLAKVQRGEPFALRTYCCHVQRELHVYSFAVTHQGVRFFENLHHVTDVGALFTLQQVLFAPVSPGLLHNLW